MRLTSKHHYLDHNATSPVADSVNDWISKGDFFFGNANSRHSSGQKSQKIINTTKNLLLKKISHLQGESNLFFHSGATEGINTIVKGFWEAHPNGLFLFSEIDHKLCFALSNWGEKKSFKSQFCGVNEDGSPDLEGLEKLLDSNKNRPILLNYLWANNETGVIWDQSLLNDLKAKHQGLVIHVDAAQSIGKIEFPFKHEQCIDFATYSGHKFGAFKGVGWTYTRSIEFPGLIEGGGDQGLRGGTPNTEGIYSIYLALEELEKKIDFVHLDNVYHKIQSSLQALEPLIKCYGCTGQGGNTLLLSHPRINSDIQIAAFDMAGIQLSAGSACSSGSSLPNHVARALGASTDEAKRVIRLSWDYRIKNSEVEEIIDIFKNVWAKF